MDKLAYGVNPINDNKAITEDIFNNVNLLRCFFYVSDILRQVIENEGQVTKSKIKQSNLMPFEISLEQKNKITVFDEPVMISRFTNSINELVDLTVMKKLKTTAFTTWLLEKGFLTEEVVNNNRKKVPTEMGKQIGIFPQERIAQYGGYTAILYNKDAQKFLIDNLDEIILISNKNDI